MLISRVPLAVSMLVALRASGSRLRQQSYDILSAVSISVQIRVRDYLGLLESGMATFRSDRFTLDQLLGRLLLEKGVHWNPAPMNYYLMDGFQQKPHNARETGELLRSLLKQ